MKMTHPPEPGAGNSGLSGAQVAIHIRPFLPVDETRVREICYATALLGGPIQPLIPDLMWVSDALLGYHLVEEPDLLLVAEAEGVIAGYLAGGTDVRRQQRWFRKHNLWPLMLRAVRSRRILNARTCRTGLALVPAFWGVHRQAPHIHLEYPAFLHINLAGAWQGRGVGAQLLEKYLADLRARRIPGLHVSTGTVAGQAFFAKHGFREMAARPRPEIPGVPAGKLCLMARAT